MTAADTVAALSSQRIEAALDAEGHALLPGLLDAMRHAIARVRSGQRMGLALQFHAAHP